MESVSLCVLMKSLSAFVELESAIRDDDILGLTGW
jgi:hypothetical protein